MITKILSGSRMRGMSVKVDATPPSMPSGATVKVEVEAVQLEQLQGHVEQLQGRLDQLHAENKPLRARVEALERRRPARCVAACGCTR